MFPATDFNFVVCGIATFAATIGYTCVRKLSMSTTENPEARDSTPMAAPIPSAAIVNVVSGPSSQAEVGKAPEPSSSSANTTAEEVLRQTGIAESTLARRPSLKRKIPHDGFDEPTDHDLEYPHNLANIYPRKRCRTPSSDGEKQESSSSSTEKQGDPELVAEAIPPIVPIQDVDISIPFVSDEPELIAAPPTPPRIYQDVSIPFVSYEPEPVAALPVAIAPPRTPSPAPKAVSSKASHPGPNSPVPTAFSPPSTPRPSMPAAISSASRGFAAFAGSSSPFATVRMSPQSPFKPARSIWAMETPDSSDAFASTSASTSNAIEGSGVAAAATAARSKNHAISAVVPSSAQTVTYITGEENEDVELELKGVKLYVKRGSRPFSDGMLGHVKLLSNRTTLDERLLFRREPLWKVSMNVRVQPAVRCTFDADEHVVRLVLKEPVEQPTAQQDGSNEIVVYALKPGRSCSKQDFKEFAESLVASAHWKPLAT